MKYWRLFLLTVITISIASCTASKKTGKKDKNKYSLSFDVPDSVSYSIGLSMGNYLQNQGIESMDNDAFGKGMKKGAALMPEKKQSEVDSAAAHVQTYMMENNQKVQQKMATDENYVPEPLVLPTNISHDFGILLGSNLIEQNLEKANVDKMINGIKDHFAETPKYEKENVGEMLDGYFKTTDSLRVNLNEQYLADNKLKKDVITTESGLQYKVLRKGEGKMPTATDKVKVNYKGTFINGKTFDSSYERGEPTEFGLNQVIPGWTEGIALMPVGSKYIFAIPYDIAYGEQGSRSIPPKSTLIFEVELLEIVGDETSMMLEEAEEEMTEIVEDIEIEEVEMEEIEEVEVEEEMVVTEEIKEEIVIEDPELKAISAEIQAIVDGHKDYSLSFGVPNAVAYNIGLSMGGYLQDQGIKSIDINSFDKGMRDGAVLKEEDKQTRIASAGKNVQTFMTEYRQKMEAKIQADPSVVPQKMVLPMNVSNDFGVLLGSNLAAQNLDKANISEVIQGVKDLFSENRKYSKEKGDQILEDYFSKMDKLRTGLNQKYLDENKLKPGVITTPIGLQYEILKKGTGKMPVATNKVKVHYHGTFINGKVFDSSVDRGEPAEFGLNQVIRGWTEGVVLMPVGSKFRFTIPYPIAYGEQGSRTIPPKSTLIFEIELLEIVE